MSLVAVKGLAFTGISSFTRGRVNVPVIDLLSPVLDSRLTYSGPAHSFLGNDGTLKQSAVNEWPLEYRNGVAVGRHEPEPAATNIITDPMFTNLVKTPTPTVGQWSTQGGGLGTVQANTGIQGGPAFNTTVGYYQGAVHDGTDFIVQPNNDWQAISLPNSWERLKQQARFASDAAMARFYPAYQDATNYVYFCCAAPQGDVVYTTIRLPWRGTNNNYRHCWSQAEKGKLATSPVVGTRAASSVMVAQCGGAKGVRLVYSDGSRQELAFGGQRAMALPIASLDWATRYLTRIEYF
ncbi:hypothetical protein PQA73_gp05 [Erwinia phage Pavtok]|uniref:Uncharacterized protein n=1 Tax=Erwinia phage Pavtok TaxID=2267655 RepID=A0A345BLW2_9CAUD|nr:hypothetical protein PQA73_gp05 [Erwinia phage Pavtok]AXF51433.1 hypothetical protein PAVTOK_5 [Erwinia phage Pavtok]